MSPSHRLEVRGLRIVNLCVVYFRFAKHGHVKVVHWVFKHHITHGPMHAVVLSYEITRVCLSLWAHEVVVDQLNVQRERG